MRMVRTSHLAATAVALAMNGAVATGGAQADGPGAILVHAGRLIDGVRPPQNNYGILIEGERIVRVGPYALLAGQAGDARRIDLSAYSVLPGLIDAHTHLFLDGSPFADQILKQSIPFRTIQATTAARAALRYGFTSIRDLETEGAMYADVDVKRAIERGIISGPRMQVATRALAPTGMYPLAGAEYSWELQLPVGAQIVDGADNLRRAIREQVTFGADWIKVYVDRGVYIGTDGRLHSLVNWTDEELAAIVGETRRLGKRVSAHARGWEGIDAALRAGVHSIEHGDGLTADLMDRMVQQGVFWCPTIYVGVRQREGPPPPLRSETADIKRRAFGVALQRPGMADLVAFGTDAGGFTWSENPAREFAVMVRYGMTSQQAISAATTNAAKLLGRSHDLGRVAPGYFADLVALRGDPIAHPNMLEGISWVMKGGEVVEGPGQKSEAAHSASPR